jgi:hypothetical protein
VTFMVQFIRFRRGVPEVVRTLHLAATEESTAFASEEPCRNGILADANRRSAGLG